MLWEGALTKFEHVSAIVSVVSDCEGLRMTVVCMLRLCRRALEC